MKKKSLVMIVLSLITLFTIGVTVSYFTDKAEAVNTITMGKIDVEVEERIIENGKEMVGAINTGENTAWIRVFVGFPVGTGGTDVYVTSGYEGENPDTNGEGWSWSQGADGYYYYSNPVDPGDTAYLFSSIMKSETIEKDKLPSNIDIIIYAEAVQVSLGDSAIVAFENLKK